MTRAAEALLTCAGSCTEQKPCPACRAGQELGEHARRLTAARAASRRKGLTASRLVRSIDDARRTGGIVSPLEVTGAHAIPRR